MLKIPKQYRSPVEDIVVTGRVREAVCATYAHNNLSNAPQLELTNLGLQRFGFSLHNTVCGTLLLAGCGHSSNVVVQGVVVEDAGNGHL